MRLKRSVLLALKQKQLLLKKEQGDVRKLQGNSLQSAVLTHLLSTTIILLHVLSWFHAALHLSLSVIFVV